MIRTLNRFFTSPAGYLPITSLVLRDATVLQFQIIRVSLTTDI